VLPYFGRRPLYLSCLLATMISLLIIGILACFEITNGSQIAMAVLMIFIQLMYSTSIGPLCKQLNPRPPYLYITSDTSTGYAISGELPNSRVRPQSIVMGRSVYVICGFITGQIGPRFVNPTGWNLGAKSAFFWLGTNVVCTTWCFFRLPETGGFSFAELDILFANRVPARKFRHVVIHDEMAETKQPHEEFVEDKATTQQVAHLEEAPVASL
jgi:SP family general alpha glucoside:H+ symporter-like MFS transporter